VAAFEWLVKLPKKEREMDLSGVRDAAMLTTAFALAINPDCPNQADGCTGTAVKRAAEAVQRARTVDLNRPWPAVRDDIVQACGLRVQTSTSHCFNDFNHVDCCAMDTGRTHNTNEESRVVGASIFWEAT